MQNTSFCPLCGKPLPTGAPQGLCPECLMQGAFPTGTDAALEETAPRKSPRFIPPAPDALAPSFPGLDILEFIGQGGMGAVYKARQKELDRIVALKILPPETSAAAGFAERFALEAKALARLNHPNIVTLFEFGRADGLFFFLMEFVDGVTLRQLLNAGRMSPREALAIVPQICDALQFAHDQGIVHRDIKPENVLLDRRGQVKVADFGLAKLVQAEGESGADSAEQGDLASTLTETGKVMGTPQYMAPEQFAHPADVDHRADIYALGVVFYQMLTGQLPGQEMEWPLRKVRIDVRLNEIVLRALEKEPERRYQQASQVKTAVENLDAPEAPDPASAAAPVPLSPVRVPPAIASAGTALLILGVAGLLASLVLQMRGFSGESLDVSLGAFGYWRLPMPALISSSAIAWMHWSRLLNLAILLGGWRVRRLEAYSFGVSAAVLAWCALPLQPVGLLVGAWVLTVLIRKESRAAFATAAAARSNVAPGPARLSKLAVAAAILMVVPVLRDAILAVWMVLGAPQVVSQAVFGGQLFSSFLVSLFSWAPLATTFLGWVALEDIRRANGALKGSALAALVLPYVPVEMALGWLIPMGHPMENTPPENMVLGLVQEVLTLAACAGFALWIQWREGRQLRRMRDRSSDAFPRGWLMSNPALWTIRLLVCGLVVYQMGTSIASSVRASARYANRWSQNLASFQAPLHQHLFPDDSTNRFVAVWPGGEVEVVALTDLSSQVLSCWRPNGQVLCPGPSAPGKSRPLLLELRVPAQSELLALPFRLLVDGQTTESIGSFTRGDQGEPRGFIHFVVGSKARSLNLRLARPVEDWQNTDAGWEWNGKMPRHPQRHILRSGQQFVITLEQVAPSDRACTVTFSLRGFPANWMGRVVAMDDAGALHEPATPMPALQDVSLSNYIPSATFNNLPSDQVREFRFQLRRGAWMEFRNLSLQPGVAAAIEVVDPGRSQSSRLDSTP